LEHQQTLKKNEGQEGDTGLVSSGISGRGEHEERVNEGEYGGCISYSYMKTGE
jgi:hypothetical protein